MNKIEKESLRYGEMNDIMYSLLCELDRVCQKYGVTYYLAYGTLIGAIRDHDLIRWDDDVDVFITNSNLKTIIDHKDEFKPGFKLVLPEDYGENKYYDSVVRLNYTNSIVCNYTDETRYYNNLRTNVSLDLFRISCVPQGLLGWCYGVYMCILYGMANAYRYQNPIDHYSIAMKIADIILRPAGKFLGMCKLRNLIQNGLVFFEGKDYKKVHNNDDDIGAMFRLYDKEDFNTIKKVKIRDHVFPVPGGYDRILRKRYGDYMITPPDDTKGWKFVDVDYFKLLH